MKRFLLCVATCLLVAGGFAQTQVIAHRGYHAKEGSVRNSLSALKNAQDLGVFGSECDVNETADGYLVVVHGPNHGTYDIQSTDFLTLRKQMLENGEVLPLLEEYLDMVARKPQVKLIIEIKSHDTADREDRVVKKTLSAVKKRKLEKSVEYIAFHSHVCDELVKEAPKGTKIAYLNGDYSPAYCKSLGYTGIDYQYGVMQKNPQWIGEAKRLGLTVNVWTVNDEEGLKWCIEQGVDYITTDIPHVAKKMLK